MAAAIRKISIARGHDVSRYSLACFGGAGGQHACAVADALGMERILIHPLAGVLSAYGIGIADVKAIREMSWLKQLGEDFSEALAELEQRARDALIEQGLHGERIEVVRRARLRIAGSDTTLDIPIASEDRMRTDFAELHKRRFGYVDDDAEVIVDALVVEAIGKSSSSSLGEGYKPSAGPPPTDEPGEEFIGPALIFDATSTIVVAPGWRGERASDGTLILKRAI